MANYHEGVYIAEVVCQVLLMPVIILSNILIICAPIYWRKLRTPDNFLMVNLAVADFLIGSVVIPLRIMSRYEDPIHQMEATVETCFLLTGLEY